MNFLDLAKLRCSVRKFSDRPIEQEKLDYILECVRMAPSAVNYQPWRFAIIKGGEQLDAVKATYHNPWINDVPCLIVACGNHDEAWHRKIDGKDHTDIDVAIAVEHLCLAAAEQGLGTCWVCNFDAARCREILGLSEAMEPVALIPIGYPASDAMPEKKRKPLDEILL